ncbi:MAG: Tn3 family transposase, partial [Acidobacteriota bacterium]
MFDRLLGLIFRRSERRHAEQFQAQAPAFQNQVELLVRLGRALILIRDQGGDPLAAVDEAVGWDRLAAAVAEAERLSQPEIFEHLALLEKHHSTLRRLGRVLISTFEFRADSTADALLRAVHQLGAHYTTGFQLEAERLPLSFVPRRWRPLVAPGGRINLKFYEICVFLQLRDRLRAGDMWVVGSRRYRDFEEYLLPRETFEAKQRDRDLGLAIDVDARSFLAKRREHLEEQLRTVERKAESGDLPDVQLRNGVLKITPLRRVESAGA